LISVIHSLDLLEQVGLVCKGSGGEPSTHTTFGGFPGAGSVGTAGFGVPGGSLASGTAGRMVG
jgi:hypothetical protein